MMNEAINMYEGKPEEHQLVLMNAQLRLQRGDADGAIRILDAVKPGFIFVVVLIQFRSIQFPNGSSAYGSNIFGTKT